MSLDDACLGAFQQELGYIYRSFRRLGAPPSEVEDLAQDLFVALRRSWSKYDPSRPLRPYLFGFAFRIAAANERKRTREVALGKVEVDDTGPGVEAELESYQTRQLVFGGAQSDSTSEACCSRDARKLDDVPVAVVASTLSIPLFTVYSRLRKARRELQARIRRLLREAGGE